MHTRKSIFGIIYFLALILFPIPSYGQNTDTSLFGKYTGNNGVIIIQQSNNSNMPYAVYINSADKDGSWVCEYNGWAWKRDNTLYFQSTDEYIECKTRIKISSDGNTLEVKDACSEGCGLNGTILGTYIKGGS